MKGEIKMNFGQNALTWFQSNAQPIVLIAIIAFGIYFALKRELTKLLGALLIFVLAVGFVYDPAGVKEILLSLFKKIFGAV